MTIRVYQVTIEGETWHERRDDDVAAHLACMDDGAVAVVRRAVIDETEFVGKGAG